MSRNRELSMSQFDKRRGRLCPKYICPMNIYVSYSPSRDVAKSRTLDDSIRQEAGTPLSGVDMSYEIYVSYSPSLDVAKSRTLDVSIRQEAGTPLSGVHMSYENLCCVLAVS